MLVKLSPEKRKSLGGLWSRQVTKGLEARQGLASRWTRCWNQYKGIEDGGLRLIPDMPPRFMPLTKPKIDRILGTVASAITSIKPWVQVIPEDDASAGVSEAVEKSLQHLAEKGDFERHLTRWLLQAAICGVGVPQVQFDPRRGIEFRSIPPRHLSIYPAAFADFSRATQISFSCPETGREVQAKIDSGEYYKDAEFCTDHDPQDRQDGAHSEQYLTNSVDQIDRKEAGLVDQWEVLVWANLSQDLSDPAISTKEQLYVARLDLAKEEVLACWEYNPDYEGAPWIFDMRFEEEDEGTWSSSSLAHSLQGLQLLYNDLITFYIGGSYASAFPPIIISKGLLGKQFAKYGPAQIFEFTNDVKVDVIPIHFNPGGIPDMIGKVEEIADRVSRISTIGTGQQFKSGTTATESAGLMEMQRQAEDSYTASVSLCLQRIWAFMFTLLKTHFHELKDICGDAIPINDIEEIENAKFLYEVNGKASTNSPTATIEKVTRALEFAQLGNDIAMQMGAPPRYNIHELIDQGLQAINLPTAMNKVIMEQTQEEGVGQGDDSAILEELLMAMGGGEVAGEAGIPPDGGVPVGPGDVAGGVYAEEGPAIGVGNDFVA